MRFMRFAVMFYQVNPVHFVNNFVIWEITAQTAKTRFFSISAHSRAQSYSQASYDKLLCHYYNDYGNIRFDSILHHISKVETLDLLIELVLSTELQKIPTSFYFQVLAGSLVYIAVLTKIILYYVLYFDSYCPCIWRESLLQTRVIMKKVKFGAI